MNYILKHSDSTITPITIQPLQKDDSTDLTFVGRGYANYGEIHQTNALNLLENFASTTAPTKPIVGQLWYNSSPSVQQLNVCIDFDANGPIWITIQDMAVITATFGQQPLSAKKGALWYDFSVTAVSERLKVYDGVNWINVVSTAVISISSQAPANPLRGQVWYDTISGTLKAWNELTSQWFPIAQPTAQDESLKYAFILAM